MCRKTLALLLLIGLACGCRESTAPPESASLTNEQLLKLLGGELFEVRIPMDIRPEQHAGLAIRHADGKRVTMASTSGWVPGEIVKVACFAVEGSEFRYAFLTERMIFRGSNTRFPVVADNPSSTNSKRTNLQPGEFLVRYSMDNRLTMTGDPEGDDFDIVFHVQEVVKEAGSPTVAEP